MTEDIDYDRAMFSPVGPPRLPSDKVTTTPFRDAFYPTQLGNAAQLGLGGELRGFYASNTWKPSWSRYGFPRPDGNHGGVDIYAPRGEPIVAIVDGEVEFRPASDNNAMGNRAHLMFRASGGSWRFVFGHLDRFEGAARSVRRGDVLGYAGCTGNAAGSQPCLTPNRCGKFSTHLHLQLMRDGVNPPLYDPLAALGWKLRYDDIDGVTNCEDALLLA